MSKLDRRAFIATAVAASVGIGSGLIAGRHWGRDARGDMEAIDLGLAAATAGAVGIGTGLLVGRRTKGPVEGQSIDIVIIGAGVAGTLAAHRLSARYPAKSIAVFESRSRVGGRLWSVPVPPVENELGSFRTKCVQTSQHSPRTHSLRASPSRWVSTTSPRSGVMKPVIGSTG